MTYIAPADFRTTTLAEYCEDIPLDVSEADDTRLTATIARKSAQLDRMTNDHFESQTLTLTLNGYGRPSLSLPKRCTAVSQVQTIDRYGAVSTQTAGIWRLVSSLNSAGSDWAPGRNQFDMLSIIPGRYLIGMPWWSPLGVWPYGANSVTVAGTFGWTVTPAEIKRACALLVWDHIKFRSDILVRSNIMQTAQALYNVADTPPEVADIVSTYYHPQEPF